MLWSDDPRNHYSLLYNVVANPSVSTSSWPIIWLGITNIYNGPLTTLSSAAKHQGSTGGRCKKLKTARRWEGRDKSLDIESLSCSTKLLLLAVAVSIYTAPYILPHIYCSIYTAPYIPLRIYCSIHLNRDLAPMQLKLQNNSRCIWTLRIRPLTRRETTDQYKDRLQGVCTFIKQ